MFVPLFRDKEHSYKNGKWIWSNQGNTPEITFIPQSAEREIKKVSTPVHEGLKFIEDLNVAGEKHFLEKFQRKSTFCDSEVVTLQDIKNLVLFILVSKSPKKFVKFVHSEIYDKFLHSIIFYFDLFLRVLEFLLIRRDHEFSQKSRDTTSLKVERSLSNQLSDRRLLVAREYSKVSLIATTSSQRL